MHKRIYSGLAIAALFSVFVISSSGSCFAQGPDQGQQGQGQGQGQGAAWMSATGDDIPTAFIEAEDANKDGKVAKDEFGGPDTMFEALDTNSDGYIELAEAPTEESLKAMQGEQGQGGGAPGGTPPEGGAPAGK